MRWETKQINDKNERNDEILDDGTPLECWETMTALKLKSTKRHLSFIFIAKLFSFSLCASRFFHSVLPFFCLLREYNYQSCSMCVCVYALNWWNTSDKTIEWETLIKVNCRAMLHFFKKKQKKVKCSLASLTIFHAVHIFRSIYSILWKILHYT